MKLKLLACGAIGAVVMALVLGLFHQELVVADNQPAPVTKESSQTFRQVVKKVLPAVVSVTAITKPVKVSRNERGNREFRRFHHFEGQVPPEFRKFLEDGLFGDFGGFGFDSPPIPPGGSGSGVIVGEGIVLTNNHVVAGADRVVIRLQDGRTLRSIDVVRDPKTDLAIIKLDPTDAKGLPVAELGDSSKLQIGDWVLAMGAPFGLQGSVTAGIISFKGRPLGMNLYEDFLQTDAAINPGNSGGPLVDLDGKIVGINTAIRSNTGTYAGIGYAIPSDIIQEVLEQLVKFGKVKRGYLGIQMRPLDPSLRKYFSLENGVEITDLTPGQTPARKAGLKLHDIILEVDSEPIEDSKQLQRLVTKTPVGNKIAVKVLRNGKPRTLTVTIEEQPKDFGVNPQYSRRLRKPDEPEETETVSIEKLGIGVEESSDGLQVTEVAGDSPAEKAGITRGMIILSAENQEVDTPKELERAIAKSPLDGKGILLLMQSPDGQTRLIVVKE